MKLPVDAALAWSVVAEPLCWPWLGAGSFEVTFLRRDGHHSLYRVGPDVCAVTVDSAARECVLRILADGADTDPRNWPPVALTWSVTADAELRHEAGALPEPLARLWRGADRFGDRLSAWAALLPDPGSAVSAAALGPAMRARGPDSERGRTLDAGAAHALRANGLFRLGLPRALGGADLPGRDIVATIETLSRADSSAGWCTLIGNQAAYLAWLDADVAKGICPDADTVLAGSTAVLGRSVAVDGGYRVSGRWPFNSGCLHADWLMAGFAEPPELTGGRPTARLAFVPKAAATVLGTWDVVGLRGTGSHDIVLDGVEVPAEHTAPLYYGPAAFGDTLHRLSPYNIQAVLMAGFPLGVARRALDELVRRAEAGDTDLSAGEITVDAVRADISLAAARALVMETVDAYWAVLATGRRLTGAEEGRLALVLRHAADTAKSVVGTVVSLAGADPAGALDRCLRDVHAGGQHIAVSDDMYERNARRYWAAT